MAAREGQPLGLVVPLFGMDGVFLLAAYSAAMERFPSLQLLLVGRPGDDAAARPLQARYASRVEFLLRAGLSESEAIQQGMTHLLERGLPFVGYWGADAEVPLEFALEWPALLDERGALMAFGSRLRLLQHQHPGLWRRHYAGRTLASAVSYVLRMQIYDTECCAKLFRNHEIVRQVFATEFETRVGFNAEVFVRLAERQSSTFSVERHCLEIPLRRWSPRTRPRYGVVHIAQRARDLLLLHKKVRGRPASVPAA